MSFVNLNKRLNHFDTKPKRRPKLRRAVAIIIILAIFLGLPSAGIYIYARKAISGAKQVSSALKQENLGQVKAGITATKSAIGGINMSLNFLIWLRVIPFVGGYYADAKHFAVAAESELAGAEVMIKSLMPYEKELGFTGGETPGQDKIAQAVKVLDKVLPNLDQIEPYLIRAGHEVQSVDTGKYPERIGSTVVKARVEEIKNFIMGAEVAAQEGKDALRIAPSALGTDSPKNYMILFQNDKEIRPTGGFLTAYAFLKIDKGHLSTTTSDDIYRLDERLLNVCKSVICLLTPPAPIVKYLPEVSGKPRTAWSMRDSNISPDLPTAAQQFIGMYKFLGDGFPFDGIIYIDTSVVEELIKITGPIDVYGTKYTAEKDSRCNCTNVIYELEHYAEIASQGSNDRKAILGSLMQQIMAKILTSGSDKLPMFISVVAQLAGDKHIMLYMTDPKAEEALAKINWTGQIKQTSGDYLHINDANFAGGKSNLYVEENVTLDIKVANDGTVTNKVTIDYKNPQPFNTWLNGILRDYVRLYVPNGAKLVSSKGSDDPVVTQVDEGLNKTYFEAFVQVRPQNSRTLQVEYTLPDKITGRNYLLLIQKQPGAKDYKYTVKINGSTKASFDLISDRQLDLNF